jgi:hypothetical protein
MKINSLQIEIDDLASLSSAMPRVKLKGASPVGLKYTSFSLFYSSSNNEMP